MYNRLHDGPTHLSTGPRTYQPPAHKSRASLAALQWAADRAGMSYGQFSQRLKREDETRIQEEFEQYRRERQTELAQRRGKSAEAEDVTNDEFIITDEDA